jgi:hypothetical protein
LLGVFVTETDKHKQQVLRFLQNTVTWFTYLSFL